ncbi:MAG: L,D-transpeptidase family protein [Ginsengibacter sp.]
MVGPKYPLFISGYILVCLSIFACKAKHAADEPQIIEKPAEMDRHVNENIEAVLKYASDNNGRINDSLRLKVFPIVESFYKGTDYKNVWSKNEEWLPLADSLFDFIRNSQAYGLYPSDYHFRDLELIKSRLSNDTIAKKDATFWTKADLLLTDAFMEITRHLKQGRLLPDSLSLSADTSLKDKFFVKNLKKVLQTDTLVNVLKKLEPVHDGYWELKKSLPAFLDSMDRTVYTYITYPARDSLALVKNLQKRFSEESLATITSDTPDSAEFSGVIKKVQKAKGIRADGKISLALVRKLNANDVELFKRIAITLDRYKQLPAVLPDVYIWVNLPAYYLQLWDHDSVVILSKTIVGKPSTRTPALNSNITDMVTYPQWTIPNSIIKKDVLPGLKKNPGYLAKKGFSLVNFKGETVDPYTINWEKYTKEIPFKVVQGSGDDNALGVLKFNFNNPYNVYLHDTNQRYLFRNSSRALSHGCVRVQDWEQLAFFIARNDSMHLKTGDSLTYNTDSIKNWLANKERKRIIVKNKIPLFIRYFTCEAKEGKIYFYDDMYGEDKTLRDKYFSYK